MREILFKAKRIDDGEWVEGWLFLTKDNTYIAYTSQFDDDLFLSPQNIFIAVDIETICQYTGLTDKNGNKIWENDVIKNYNSSGMECHIEQIIWSDYGLNEGWCSKGIKSLIKYDKRVFNTGFGKSDARKCEVIGNIFDNAELLRGSEGND